jgi:AraC-like DNA-binding protein
MANGIPIIEPNSINFSHHKSNEVQDMSFHFQDQFEIYYYISGDVNYFIEKNVYQLKHGDLFVVNSSEIHKATFRSGDAYERIVILFDPELIHSLETRGSLHLLDCFINRPKGEQNKINPNKHQREDIMSIFSRFDLANLAMDESADYLRLAYLIELLVLINQAVQHGHTADHNQLLPMKLAPIIDFINSNLDCNLSLETLAEKFFINKYYLSGLFKKNTGLNIHEYIIIKRISKAKGLLCENLSISEVCQQSGFGDYSHFIRAFKQYVGISPGQYKRQHSTVKRNILLD